MSARRVPLFREDNENSDTDDEEEDPVPPPPFENFNGNVINPFNAQKPFTGFTASTAPPLQPAAPFPNHYSFPPKKQDLPKSTALFGVSGLMDPQQIPADKHSNSTFTLPHNLVSWSAPANLPKFPPVTAFASPVWPNTLHSPTKTPPILPFCPNSLLVASQPLPTDNFPVMASLSVPNPPGGPDVCLLTNLFSPHAVLTTSKCMFSESASNALREELSILLRNSHEILSTVFSWKMLREIASLCTGKVESRLPLHG